MNSEPPVSAWPIPLSFPGVAGWAQQTLGKLCVLAALVAAVIAGAAVWVAAARWSPVIDQSLRQFPPGAKIDDGTLVWTGDPARTFAENRLLAVVVDVEARAAGGQAADLQIELNRNQATLRSLLGYVAVPYPRGFVLSLNPLDAQAWWNAWRPVVLAGIGVSTGLLFLTAWLLLATVHALPALWLAAALDADADAAASWRIAAAALLPGGLVAAGLVVGYGAGHLSLVVLLIAIPCTLIVGWVFMCGALAVAPRTVTAAGNPFATGMKNDDDPT